MHREALQGMQERWRQVVLPKALAARHEHPRPSHASICGLSTERLSPISAPRPPILGLNSSPLRSCLRHTAL